MATREEFLQSITKFHKREASTSVSRAAMALQTNIVHVTAAGDPRQSPLFIPAAKEKKPDAPAT